jgi:hypothetical protein
MPLVSPVINHSRKGAVVIFAICLIITMTLKMDGQQGPSHFAITIDFSYLH